MRLFKVRFHDLSGTIRILDPVVRKVDSAMQRIVIYFNRRKNASEAIKLLISNS